MSDLSSVLLLKLLWITNICAWPIERVTIEIIVIHEHLCVTYQACYYWNYCESQTFVCDLSSTLLFEIFVNHKLLCVTYRAGYYRNHGESRTLGCLLWIWVSSQKYILEYGFLNLHNYKCTDSAWFFTISALIVFWTWIWEFTFTATDNMRFV